MLWYTASSAKEPEQLLDVQPLERVAELPHHLLGFIAHAGHSVLSAGVTTYDRPFGRYLEDFEVGDVYKHWPGKTITEYDDHLFCMITMNHHPLHTNAWFAEHETVQGKNVVVGNLVYSLVLGMSVPDVSGSCIANLEVETLQHKHADVPRRHHLRGDQGDSTRWSRRRSPTAASSPSRRRASTRTGEEVCFFRRKLMVWKRDAAPARRFPYGDDAFG